GPPSCRFLRRPGPCCSPLAWARSMAPRAAPTRQGSAPAVPAPARATASMACPPRRGFAFPPTRARRSARTSSTRVRRMETTSTKKTVNIRREVTVCPTCKYRFSRDAAFCPFDGVKLEASPFDPLADPLVGTRVDGRYDVVSILGEGGMGRVYHVRHAALDRSFAMKVLRPELAQEADLASRFILEAKATASVKHPNVVQITDFGRMPDGVPYFVMELLIGHTLGELIKAGGPLPAARAARILRKVAGALAAAHAVGVVHRDLKPRQRFSRGRLARPDGAQR